MVIRVGYDGSFTLPPGDRHFAVLLPEKGDSYARFVMVIWKLRNRCGGFRLVWRPCLSAGFLSFESYV